MKMHIKHEITKEILPRYVRADKKEKKKSLDEFSATTGYHRKSAVRKLRQLQMTPHSKESVAGIHARNRESIDVMGNLTLGLKEQTIFPETVDEDLKDVFGMSITIVTSAKNKDEAAAFFEILGIPFKKKDAEEEKKKRAKKKK